MSIITDVRSKARRARIDTEQIPASARKVLRNTYMLLAVTLLPTIVGATAGVMYPLVLYTGVIGSLVVFLGVMFGLQYMVVRNRHSIAGINYLLLLTLSLGYFLGPLLYVALNAYTNGVELIATAFGGTALIFFGLATYATTTSRNFATPGIAKTLSIGIMMAFIMSIVGSVFALHPFMLALSAVFMVLSSMYIVYAINSVVRGGESNYILVTMTVYIMLFNIFASLLQLLMFFGGSRE